MKKTRKRHEAAFKARVALEAMKGDKTANQIASEYGIHPQQVADWKKRLADSVVGVFDKDAPKQAAEDFERERTELQSKIGELTVKVDFLVKKWFIREVMAYGGGKW
jgi:transposase